MIVKTQINKNVDKVFNGPQGALNTLLCAPKDMKINLLLLITLPLMRLTYLQGGEGLLFILFLTVPYLSIALVLQSKSKSIQSTSKKIWGTFAILNFALMAVLFSSGSSGMGTGGVILIGLVAFEYLMSILLVVKLIKSSGAKVESFT